MTSRKDLIVKDNALINASYNLDLVEQRLILLAIVEARQEGRPTDEDLTVHADSYIEHFGVHRNTAYQALKDACNALYERRFSYQKLTKRGNIENVRSRWVQRVSYVDNEALVRLRFSDDVKPLITNLEKHFTSYDLKQVAGITSAYAVRLYELLMGWKSIGKTPVFDIYDFRQKLGVESDDYKRMDHFKRKVLNFSITQINEHTDIMAKYKQHKEGRSITGFSFTFSHKNPKKTVRSNKKRQTLTKNEAAQKANPGEEWQALVKRLSSQYVITDL